MQRARLTVLLSCLAAGSGCLKVPADLPDEPEGTRGAPATAAEVLDRHVAGLGGEAAVRNITDRTVEARMVLRAEEDCDTDDGSCVPEDTTGSFILQTTSDGRMYRRTVIGDLVEEKGYDGKTGWQLQDGTTLRIENDLESEVTREDAILHWYFDVDGRDVETSLMRPRKEDAEGNIVTLDGLRWAMRGEMVSPKVMWFDRSTGLLREEVVEENQGDLVQRQTIVYDDYRDVDGVLVPFEIRVLNDLGDRQQVVEFHTQRISHDKIDETKFAVPELPPPKPVPDQRLAALRAAATAAKEAPKDAAAQVAWARAAFAVAHFDEAIEAAQATLGVDAREPEALWILARVQVLVGDDKAAKSTLKRAGRAGVRGEVIALQRAWMDFRRRDYKHLADDLDAAGNAVVAGRYRSFAGKPLQAKADACVTKVPLVASTPLAVVELEIAGEKVGAIIDTGASDVIIPESFAKDHEIPIRAMSELPDGVPNVGHGQVDKMVIGGVTVDNVPVDIFDDGAMRDMAGELEDKAKVVVGLSALSDFIITIDVPNATIELVAPGGKCEADRQARRAGKAVPFYLHETHFIYVLGHLGDAEGVYLLNTGMRGADMTATQLAFSHAGIGAPPIRSDQALMVDVPRFRLGDAVEVENAEAAFGYFEQTQTSDGFRLDGMLGLGVFGKHAITIDYETHRLYFPASG